MFHESRRRDVGGGWLFNHFATMDVQIVDNATASRVLAVRVSEGPCPCDAERRPAPDGWAGSLPVSACFRTGSGFAARHHGEILQGAWRSPDAKGVLEPVPCLVTMPVPAHGSRARFICAPEASLVVQPAWKVKAARAARLTLDYLGRKRAGGMLTVDSPVPAGLGLGSSTSDVVAAIRAVCDAHDAPIDSQHVAQLALEAEGAIDPIMFEEGMLFAPRHGRVLEHWKGRFPHFLVVSVDTDPRGGGIDTLSLPPPRYTAAELAQYEELICRARHAFSLHDAAAMGTVATRSAELNQRRVPMRGFRDLLTLMRQPGCLGLQISHSGTVAGLLFDPAVGQGAADTVQPALRPLGMRFLGTFTTGEEENRASS